MKLTCIICPRGCEMEVTRDGDKWIVTGNECKRGENYAVQEAANPMRTLTTSLPVSGGDYDMLSVKTAQPIPKNMIDDALKALKDKSVQAPVHVGQCIFPDIAGTGVDIVATRKVKAVDK
jgi:CxxC motif-containing protein